MVAERSSFAKKRGGGSEMIRHFILLCFSTTDYMHSTTPYHPHGVPIFPSPPPPASLRTVPLGSDHPLSTHLAMARRHKVYTPGLAF